MKVNVSIHLNPQFVNSLALDLSKAMQLTMEDTKDNLVTSQTMPFDSGDMQNDMFTTVLQDAQYIAGYLIADKIYARYQFYGISRKGNPLNYQTVNNPYARSHWLEPYLDGAFLTETFGANLKSVREGT